MADNNILITFHMLILAVAWGSVVVMIYSCMVLIWRSRKQRDNPQLPQAVIRIGNQTLELIPKLIIYLIAVVCAALIVALYHCIRIRRCMQRQQHGLPQQQRRRAFHFRHDDQQSSLDNSIADLIPVHKFSKSTLDFESENDNICAICLSDFEEGEELRKLPQCVHSFHVTCIDMWFYSHTSCPICRTDATPSLQVLMHYLESDSVGPGVESREA